MSKYREENNSSVQLLYYLNWLYDEPSVINLTNLRSIDFVKYKDEIQTHLYMVGSDHAIHIETDPAYIVEAIEKGYNVIYIYKHHVYNELWKFNELMDELRREKELENQRNARTADDVQNDIEASISPSNMVGIESFYEFYNKPDISSLSVIKAEALYKDYIKAVIQEKEDADYIALEHGKELVINGVAIPPGYTLERELIVGEANMSAEEFIIQFGCLPDEKYWKENIELEKVIEKTHIDSVVTGMNYEVNYITGKKAEELDKKYEKSNYEQLKAKREKRLKQDIETKTYKHSKRKRYKRKY